MNKRFALNILVFSSCAISIFCSFVIVAQSPTFDYRHLSFTGIGTPSSKSPKSIAEIESKQAAIADAIGGIAERLVGVEVRAVRSDAESWIESSFGLELELENKANMKFYGRTVVKNMELVEDKKVLIIYNNDIVRQLEVANFMLTSKPIPDKWIDELFMSDNSILKIAEFENLADGSLEVTMEVKKLDWERLLDSGGVKGLDPDGIKEMARFLKLGETVTDKINSKEKKQRNRIKELPDLADWYRFRSDQNEGTLCAKLNKIQSSKDGEIDLLLYDESMKVLENRRMTDEETISLTHGLSYSSSSKWFLLVGAGTDSTQASNNGYDTTTSHGAYCLQQRNATFLGK